MSRPQGRNPVLPLPLQILLLDLSSGAVLWSQALPGLPRDPQSASLPTADHRSAFFFWPPRAGWCQPDGTVSGPGLWHGVEPVAG